MGGMKTAIVAVAALAAALIAADCGAQGFPGRGRMGSPREGQQSRDRTQNERIVPTDPYSALERELPSLEVDLQIRKEQLDMWRVFARDVRDVAEMDRAQRRHLMSLREGGDQPPTGSTLIASLVEDARLKSEASQELKRHYDQLYATMDEAQRRTIDRRIVQSQVEPLGR